MYVRGCENSVKVFEEVGFHLEDFDVKQLRGERSFADYERVWKVLHFGRRALKTCIATPVMMKKSTMLP